jgi:hypothetical protein
VRAGERDASRSTAAWTGKHRRDEDENADYGSDPGGCSKPGNPVTAEGFHGLIAFDADGDRDADFSTWLGVGPDGTEIPLEAQFMGPACRGLTNLGIYFTKCL